MNNNIETLNTNNYVEPKKKGNKLIFPFILVLLLLLGTVGFVLYDKGIIPIDKKEEVKEEKKIEKEEELDINSRLVQYLYNIVSYDIENDCFSGWMFGPNKMMGPSSEEKDKDYVFSGCDKTAMRIVGHNLNNNLAKSGLASEAPTVSERKNEAYSNGMTYYYEKKYIENLYKEIFGATAELDTSIPISLDEFENTMLYYDSKTDRYYPQIRTLGAVCGGGISYKLEKADKEGKTIKLYQKATLSGENITTEEWYFVYTFELEDDMYKFISRTKED